jgi:hypothetical protein
LFAETNTPFDDRRTATNPAFFLFITKKLKTVSIYKNETVYTTGFERVFTNHFWHRYQFFRDMKKGVT